MSLLSPLSYSALPPVADLQTGVNYGMNSLRFLAPVRSGKRVRGHFILKDLVERTPGRWQCTLDASVEILLAALTAVPMSRATPLTNMM